MKIYVIESSSYVPYCKDEQYRWYSLYNSAKGSWNCSKEKAEKEGKQHERIIKKIYNIKDF